MTTVLLTGFEPFAGASSNSSWDAVERAAQLWEGDADLVIELIPVTFAGAATAISELIATHSPDLVISVGLADGRDAVTPERIAVNVEDARIPDNAGDQPSDRSVIDQAPAAYFSRLPVKAIAERIREAGIPSRVSNSAGTYVCNSLMYRELHDLGSTDVLSGFVHVPCSPELAAGTTNPSLEIDELARALVIAIQVSLESLAAKSR
jgi:pyroglutamyl-peptidase